jgi:hypothetical protein
VAVAAGAVHPAEEPLALGDVEGVALERGAAVGGLEGVAFVVAGLAVAGGEEKGDEEEGDDWAVSTYSSSARAGALPPLPEGERVGVRGLGGGR